MFGCSSKFVSISATLSSSRISSCQTKGFSTFSSSKRDEDKPTVVLLGWLGCKEKYLEKYSNWYEGKGLNTVSYIAPVGTILIPAFASQQSAKLLKKLENKIGANSPLVFHTFSGNGVHTYGMWLRDARRLNHPMLQNLRCVVLDSPPFSIEHEDAVQGFAHMAPDRWKKPAEIFYRGFFSFYFKLMSRHIDSVEHLLLRNRPPVPQLILYSDADLVTRSAGLPRYVESQRKDNIDVITENFIDSPHCQHMRYHPQQYWKAVTQFLQREKILQETESLAAYAPPQR